MTSAAPTLKFKLFETVGLCVHTSNDPTKSEWNAYVAAVSAARPALRSFLVYSLGGGPNVLQRKQLTTAFLSVGEPYVAVISHSTIVRNILAAFNFVVDRRMKVFAPTQLQEAIQSLGISNAAQSELTYYLSRIGLELGVRIDVGAAHQVAP